MSVGKGLKRFGLVAAVVAVLLAFSARAEALPVSAAGAPAWGSFPVAVEYRGVSPSLEAAFGASLAAWSAAAPQISFVESVGSGGCNGSGKIIVCAASASGTIATSLKVTGGGLAAARVQQLSGWDADPNQAYAACHAVAFSLGITGEVSACDAAGGPTAAGLSAVSALYP